jgi:branched-chain amino acid transport system substrate-binding protein
VTSEGVFKAWVDSANASGGVEGHPVQVTYEDDGSVPGTSASDAASLVSDKVDVIVDDTVLDDSWASAVKPSNIPVICIVIGTPCYTNSDFYAAGQTGDSSAYAAVSVAKAAGASNLGFLYCAEAPTCAQTASIVQGAGQSLGVPLLYKGSIAITAPNYTAQCLAAYQDHVSSLFIADIQQPLERVGEDCSRQNYDPIYVSEGTGFGMGQASSPGIEKNLWSEYSNLPFWVNTPAVQSMNAALDKYYPGLRTNQALFSETSAESWPAGLLLADAVKSGNLGTSGTPSAAEIVSGLESLHGDTLDGWSPPLTFPAGQPHSIDCWFIGHVSNGVPSLVNNGKAFCKPGS